MKALLSIAILIGSSSAFASADWYTANNVTKSQNSLEFHTGTQLVPDNTLSDYGTDIKLHTFSSKAEPESWVLMEIGRSAPEKGCFELYDLNLRGAGLSVAVESVSILPNENSFYHEEFILIKYSMINQEGEEETGTREVKILPSLDSCENNVELF